MAKIAIPVTQTVDAFEVNGKFYKFNGKVKTFLVPDIGKVTVEEAFENPELLATLVKTKSVLVEEIENALVVEETVPKNQAK